MTQFKVAGLVQFRCRDRSFSVVRIRGWAIPCVWGFYRLVNLAPLCSSFQPWPIMHAGYRGVGFNCCRSAPTRSSRL